MDVPEVSDNAGETLHNSLYLFAKMLYIKSI